VVGRRSRSVPEAAASGAGGAARLLESGFLALGFDPEEADDLAPRLLAYAGLLERWNRVDNLTAVRGAEAIVRRHVLDSLAVLPELRGRRLLDVGTGAGLPGLVLAAARPELECVLLDASAKRVRFCRQAAGLLALRNVETVHARIEDYRPPAPFDTVIARAFGRAAALAPVAGRLLAPSGRLLLMKGSAPRAERDELSARGLASEVVRIEVPELAAERHLLIVERRAS